MFSRVNHVEDCIEIVILARNFFNCQISLTRDVCCIPWLFLVQQYLSALQKARWRNLLSLTSIFLICRCRHHRTGPRDNLPSAWRPCLLFGRSLLEYKDRKPSVNFNNVQAKKLSFTISYDRIQTQNLQAEQQKILMHHFIKLYQGPDHTIIEDFTSPAFKPIYRPH